MKKTRRWRTAAHVHAHTYGFCSGIYCGVTVLVLRVQIYVYTNMKCSVLTGIYIKIPTYTHTRHPKNDNSLTAIYSRLYTYTHLYTKWQERASSLTYGYIQGQPEPHAHLYICTSIHWYIQTVRRRRTSMAFSIQLTHHRTATGRQLRICVLFDDAIIIRIQRLVGLQWSKIYLLCPPGRSSHFVNYSQEMVKEAILQLAYTLTRRPFCEAFIQGAQPS